MELNNNNTAMEMDILSTIENENSKLLEVKSQLFQVVKKPLVVLESGFISPTTAFATYRSTGGAPLGVVGKDFQPTQVESVVDSFYDTIIEMGGDVNTFEYNEFMGGSKVNLSAVVGKVAYKNLKGNDDELLLKLNYRTGYDGRTTNSLYLSVFRMFCSNGMKSWKTEFAVSHKNTMSNIGKIELTARDISRISMLGDNFKEYLSSLGKKQYTKEQREEYIVKAMALKIDEKKGDFSTKAKNIINKVNEAIEIEAQYGGDSVWTLLNGITRYTNHMVKDDAQDVLDYIYAGSGEKINDRAQELAYTMFK